MFPFRGCSLSYIVFVAAETFEDARSKVKLIPEFQGKKMHIDGLQEVQVVDGHQIRLEFDSNFENKTQIINYKHRDLAPKVSKPTQ
ncbi:MAG: hypothetical protein KDD45_02820 [Bdellovibrionales bacterium]|nr:hypothetical protein [Bdellovibrionales bacterium]